jgi:hypothetical protein
VGRLTGDAEAAKRQIMGIRELDSYDFDAAVHAYSVWQAIRTGVTHGALYYDPKDR